MADRVFSTFGGYGLYWLLIERIGVTPVNSLMFLVAPVTSVWGAAMFGEPLTLLTVLGLTLALVAALVARRTRSESASPEAGIGDMRALELASPRRHA